MSTEVQEIRISEVINLLKSGYKRWTKDEIEPGKSIQSHYHLSFSDCKRLVNNPALKGIKTIVPKIRVIDDRENVHVTPTSSANNTISIGHGITSTPTTSVPTEHINQEVQSEVIDVINPSDNARIPSVGVVGDAPAGLIFSNLSGDINIFS